ncbi:MAG: beta-galactosidase [Bacteroidales bacterium]|nr:beta-galactosidase [Bacteroidales bacterium]
MDNRFTNFLILFILCATLLTSCFNRTDNVQWSYEDGPLMTRWAKDITPINVLPEYPRPQMVRNEWMNLNGLWQYAVTDKQSGLPESYQGEILVPFPIESALSGVMQKLNPDQILWYHRLVKIPSSWREDCVLLHFGAVDWKTTVYINGKQIGTHQGGFDPFTFDITRELKSRRTIEITVKVWDPTDLGWKDPSKGPRQPVGKQVSDPIGTLYSQVSGIWQTVWIEPVPKSRIGKISLVSDIDNGLVQINVSGVNTDSTFSIVALVRDSGKDIISARGMINERILMKIPEFKLWSPDHPFLYDLEIILTKGKTTIDKVASYFGMRKIALGKDEEDVTRILLNNQFVFQVGPLDQGYWPDGLYTAPTDEALRFDVELVKKLGFNMVRKHAKVEPDRWYYWCDKLGLIVWQDMVPKYPAAGYGTNEIYTSDNDAKQFEYELFQMIERLRNHPSIVMWIIFNETWGQYNTKRLTNWVKDFDTTRLVNSASGCENFGVGDIIDGHQYPGPDPGPSKSWPKADPDEWQWEVRAMPEIDRALVLGEYGGIFLTFSDHSWHKTSEGLNPFINAGYPMLQSSEELTATYEMMSVAIEKMIGDHGLSGAVYTQLSDIEVECNGFITYDREVIKVDIDRINKSNKAITLD